MHRLLALLLLTLTACGDPESAQAPRFFSADAYPDRLSDWGLFERVNGELRLRAGAQVYDLNTALFSDYAQKLRAIHLPPGGAATYHPSDAFEFPVGTVISKTFFYPRGNEPERVQASYSFAPGQQSLDLDAVRLLETRLLVRQADGWDALPYVWQGNDAVLKLAGALIPLSLELDADNVVPLPYIVPTRNECAGCHATDHTRGTIEPIGPRARHLNRGYLNGPGNQLLTMTAAGRLDGLPDLEAVPANAALDSDAPLEARARAYLDINCGHCHNPKGAADTSGLFLDAHTSDSRALGICKPPIAAGQGTGGRPYSIVPGSPEDSILVFRMITDDPGARMPEIGRSLIHREGVALVSDWIRTLPGECVTERPVASAAD